MAPLRDLRPAEERLPPSAWKDGWRLLGGALEGESIRLPDADTDAPLCDAAGGCGGSLNGLAAAPLIPSSLVSSARMTRAAVGGEDMARRRDGLSSIGITMPDEPRGSYLTPGGKYGWNRCAVAADAAAGPTTGNLAVDRPFGGEFTVFDEYTASTSAFMLTRLDLLPCRPVMVTTDAGTCGDCRIAIRLAVGAGPEKEGGGRIKSSPLEPEDLPTHKKERVKYE